MIRSPIISFLRLMLRSLRFHRRLHIAVACGTAVAAIALTGALLVGDSLKASLNSLVDDRLGQTHHVLVSPQGFFSAAIADSISEALPVRTAPVIQRTGTAVADGGKKRANKVTIVGVDNRFWSMGPSCNREFTLGDGEAVINEALARKLGLSTGKELVVRFDRRNLLPIEAPFSGSDRKREALRVKVVVIVNRAQFGDFSLSPEPYAVYNVFVPLKTLAGVCKKPDNATTVLIGESDGAELGQVLDRVWSLDDAGIHIKKVLHGDFLEITSDRIFLDSSIVSSITKIFPDARPVFAYFVNSFSRGTRTTPYSFVSTPPFGVELADNEILLGQWAADDLAAHKGDSITMSYFVLRGLLGLLEEQKTFMVADIVPQHLPWTDSTLMPPFPGLADAGSCTDWAPGTTINLDLIRPKDEAYWDRWRGTPKAFVGLSAARRLWTNRYGSCTAIRIPSDNTHPVAQAQKLLREALKRSSSGLYIHQVRQALTTSVSQGTSFAPLFAGLSFFLIVAAAILTSLLFALSLHSRADDYRYLVSTGFTRAHLTILFLGEGLAAAGIGAIAGAVLSPIYTFGMLAALQTIWHAAAQTPSLNLRVNILSIIYGAVTTVFIAGAAMWFSVRSYTKSLFLRHRPKQGVHTKPAGNASLWVIITLVCTIGAIIILAGVVTPKGKDAAGAFFGAGSLLMAAMLSLFNGFLIRIRTTPQQTAISFFRLALTAIARRKGRSIATASLFACALFVLGGVSAFRQNTITNPRDPQAGTGGFVWYGETMTGFSKTDVVSRHRTEQNHSQADSSFSFVAMRLKDGDDASCFNLNRVQSPPILGVDTRLLDSIHCFTFVKLLDLRYAAHPWQALQDTLSEQVVPGFADQNVIEWGLRMSLGDTMHFVNKSGKLLKIVLVGGLDNSVFQGRVLIDERRFIEQFPTTGGYRVLLAQAPPDQEQAVNETLCNALLDKGLDLEPAAGRLAAFNEVENTYLSIFRILGILGLLLGSAGLGIVVMGNALERRYEIAVLRAQGYTRSHIRKLLLTEHAMIFTAGMVAGGIASLIAISPSLGSSAGASALLGLALTTGAVIFCGLASTWLAASVASSGDTMAVLREES